MSSAFDDVLSANAVYAQSFRLSGLEPVAARGLGLVTCMDSRIEPLTMLGLRPGDAKILRNAGARVTDDTLRTLVLAVYLLGVERVLIMPHTKCKMASVSGDDEVHDLIRDQYGVDTRSLEFHTDNDQLGALRHDLERVRHHPLLPDGLPVAGALYDVDTGKLEIVDE
ncbi:beta-class carbonic anhydrase [Nocardiopsis composta]|uniref:carbonic anhydrase n=1 Tax=Nocardiopsis composta TaxID=157465 RepID=A0A7W8QS16_9ACTN|nr:carbonic anhydrase [Nocardiopsis composta]MBB5435421.1 carbonic anhydrase [Nocardiopsis composta]